ncbi:MAG TPA: aminodeoxychorismate lyase [Steroidobacteraceae bacterium]|nr:aminodeoxychorismate lyase [Steroidobacteraceae bacterium]
MGRDAAPDAVWVNGVAGASLSPLDRGLHYGDGLFETIACVGGKPRFLSLHLERLARGARRLGIALPGAVELQREILALAKPVDRAVVKVLLTRGSAVARGYGLTGREQATRITLRYPWEAEDPRLAGEGVRIRTAALRLAENPPLAGIKHLNRLEQVLARREWSEPQIAEALLFSASGKLVSGVMSNVFLVDGRKLRTPLLDRCGVAGIMRAVVMREAARAGIPTEEAALGSEDLARTRELFLTSALIGLRPVSQLDGRACVPGAVTRELQQRLMPLLGRGHDD